MRTGWIISIGTELTLGQSLDTNSQWLSQQLAAVGIRVVRHVTVADELPDICRALEQAVASADIVIISGGLGPTDDDLTRAALAAVGRTTLVRDENSVERMTAFFASRNRAMPEANLVQAMIPANGRALENTCGTAPGIAMAIGSALVFAVPGVPSEMQAMIERSVAPALVTLAGGPVLRSRKLNTIGLPESELGTRIRDLMARGRNPEVGTTAANAIIGVLINAAGATAAAAGALLDADEAEVRRRLGDAVFGAGDETLAAAVGKLLRQRGRTVATAESCTGGMIGAALTEVAGSSDYYVGGVVAYSNALKTAQLGISEETLATHGAVSAAVAEQMAIGARNRLGASCALSVTGIAGPGGGSPEKPVGLVFIGVAVAERVRVIELRLGADQARDAIRIRATNVALDALRRELLRAGDV